MERNFIASSESLKSSYALPSAKEIIPFSSPKNPVDTTAQFFNDCQLYQNLPEQC